MRQKSRRRIDAGEPTMLRSFNLRRPILIGLEPPIAGSMSTRHPIFLHAGVLFLTLGFLPSMSSAVAASVTSKFTPHLGCYEDEDNTPGAYRREFCLFDRGVLYSDRMGSKEGFAACGKYDVRARGRIMFWWPGASDGALVGGPDAGNKPVKGTCRWRTGKDDDLILSNCEMKGDWKRLSDDQPHQPSAKECAPPSPAEAFVSAAGAGDLAAVQKLLARGVDINAKGDAIGRTALMAASLNGRTDVVRALLRKGADVNAKDDLGHTALFWGASDGPLDVVRALLDKGADVDAKSDDTIGTALAAASLGGHLDIVRALLDKGADVNAKSNDTIGTALAAASFGGHLNIVRALLDKGADVDAKSNKDGGTALMAASAQSDLDVVQALLESGADVNAKGSDGATALSVAKDEQVKAVLMEAGATP
jgi:ankyrin repeat protein